MSGDVKELATTLRDNEYEHVDALTATVKERPAAFDKALPMKEVLAAAKPFIRS